jgi:hypothetical protein
LWFIKREATEYIKKQKQYKNKKKRKHQREKQTKKKKKDKKCGMSKCALNNVKIEKET